MKPLVLKTIKKEKWVKRMEIFLKNNCTQEGGNGRLAYTARSALFKERGY